MIGYLIWGCFLDLMVMSTFAAMAYVANGTHCWAGYRSYHCDFTDRLWNWLFSTTSLVFLMFCQILSLACMCNQFKHCQRCKAILSGQDNHKYRAKNYRYFKCCDQCDVKRGKSNSFISNKYYFKNGSCNFCNRYNFTRAYRVYSYLKLCKKCWMNFSK